VLVAVRVRLAHERDELATLDRQLHLLHRVRELLDTDAARLIRVEGGEDRTKLLLLGVAQVLRTVEDGPLRRPMCRHRGGGCRLGGGGCRYGGGGGRERRRQPLFHERWRLWRYLRLRVLNAGRSCVLRCWRRRGPAADLASEHLTHLWRRWRWRAQRARLYTECGAMATRRRLVLFHRLAIAVGPLLRLSEIIHEVGISVPVVVAHEWWRVVRVDPNTCQDGAPGYRANNFTFFSSALACAQLYERRCAMDKR
jgi:hypothetical protein